MNREELVAAVAGFDQWHYQFDLDGVLTPIFDPAHVNRHEQRRRYFFEPLLKVSGGALTGKRVLDLGCNAGFWSLLAVEAGADYVLGIDGRQMHVDQAHLVFEQKRIPRSRYDFVCADLFQHDLARHGMFDVVLCLGLMYHVSRPVELMELMSGVSADLLLIDTEISLRARTGFVLRRESLDEFRNAVDSEMVLVPTRHAVSELATHHGYRSVIIRPRIDDYTGMPDYRAGKRRAWLCSRLSDLDPVEPEGWSAGEIAGRLPGLTHVQWIAHQARRHLSRHS